MDQPSPGLVDCPACGAKNPAIADLCAACGKSLTVVIGPMPKVKHVGIGSVMIVIAVVAVCLVPIRSAPWVSLFQVILFVPASIRGVIALERRRLDGWATPFGQAIGLFLDSFFIVLWIVLATVIGFVVACLLIGFVTLSMGRGDAGIVTALVAGAIGAPATLYVVGKKLWPVKD